MYLRVYKIKYTEASDLIVKSGTNSFTAALGSFISIFTQWGEAKSNWGGPPDWLRIQKLMWNEKEEYFVFIKRNLI